MDAGIRFGRENVDGEGVCDTCEKDEVEEGGGAEVSGGLPAFHLSRKAFPRSEEEKRGKAE